MGKQTFNAWPRVMPLRHNEARLHFEAIATTFGYPAKHQNHLRLLERMMEDNLAKRLANRYWRSKFRHYAVQGLNTLAMLGTVS